MGEFKIQSGTLIVILIIISLILISWIGGWECLNNSDCNEDETCTVKHTCYKLVIPEKTVCFTVQVSSSLQSELFKHSQPPIQLIKIKLIIIRITIKVPDCILNSPINNYLLG